jgi:hypothetical protein
MPIPGNLNCYRQIMLILPDFPRPTDCGGGSGVTIFSYLRGAATRDYIGIVNKKIDYFFELQIVAFN